MKKIQIILVTALALGTVGCAKKHHAPETLPTTSGRTTTSAAPTKGQIVNALIKANTSEVTEARLVAQKTTNPAVLDFANRLATEHAEGAREMQELATRLRIGLETCPISERIDAATRAEIAEINHRSGDDLDRQYVRHELGEHQDLLNTIDRDFLPNVREPELRAAITKTRGVVAAHLEHARRLDGELNR